MAEPEEDFETWKLILSTVTDDLSSFAELSSDFQRMMKSVEDTGSLPGELNSYTDDFVSFIYPNLVLPFFNLGPLEEEEIPTLLDFFTTVIKGFTAQMSSEKDLYLRTLKDIFEKEDVSLYKDNPKIDIRKNIIDSFISIDGFNKCIKAIETETKFFDRISILSKICFIISPFIQNQDQVDHFGVLSSIICKSCGNSIRSFPINALEILFDKIPANQEMLSLLLTLYTSQYLDKQSFAIQQLKNIAENANYKDLLIDFLTKNLDTIISVPIHTSFGNHLGTLYGFAASNGLLNTAQIQKIWESEKFIHSTILPSFYSIFELMSQKIPESDSVNYAKMILNTQGESTKLWLTMISNVAKNFMNLKYKEAFNLLREEVCLYLFQDEFESIAKEKLLVLATFDCQRLLDKVLSSFDSLGSAYVIQLMTKIIQSDEPLEHLNKVINIGIANLPEDSAVTLIQACTNRNIILSDEQKEQITKHESREMFIHKLLFDIGLDDDELTNYFDSLPQITTETYSSVIKYVSKYNNFSEVTTSLPFQKEDLLWKFALKDSGVTYQFQEFLCNNYANNDGIILTDQQMIDCFIDQVIQRIDQSENGSIYKLINKFITTVEATADLSAFKFVRHSHNNESTDVKVQFTGINDAFTFPETTPISAIIHKISPLLNIPPENLTLLYKKKTVSLSTQIQRLTSDASITFEYKTSDVPQAVPHLRTAIPTIAIQNSNLMRILLEKAKNPIIDNDLTILLNALPTSTVNEQRILAIKKCNTYNYEKNFQIDYPLLFFYNYSILVNHALELKETGSRTGIVRFLLSMINHPKMDYNVHRIILNTLISTPLEEFQGKHDEIFLAILKLSLRSHSIPISYNAIKFIISLTPAMPSSDTNYKPVIHSKIKKEEKSTKDDKHDDIDDLFREFSEYARKMPKYPHLFQDLLGRDFSKRDKGKSNSGYLDMDLHDSTDDEVIDDAMPLSHLLADTLATFLFSSNSKLINVIKEFTNKFELPADYFSALIPEITVHNSDVFCDVIENQIQHINKPENANAFHQLMDFAISHLDVNSPMLNSSMSLLYFLVQFCSNEEKDKIAHFLKDNFFDMNRKQFSDTTNEKALTLLGRVPGILKDCFDHISDDLEKIKTSNEYAIKLTSSEGRKDAVGLVNLGMTCFLNATLQQFFGIPAFRKIVINYNGDDGFLIELKNLFCRMRESSTGAVSPIKLTENWVNWDGTKLNVHTQQDASEFIQMLIDKVSLIVPQTMFRGMLVNHIDGITEEFHAERCEPFTVLALPITSPSTSLNDCLDSIHNINYFTDKNQYFAESLKKKIDAKQIEYLQNLPDHLVIQLKRFELDYNTWMLKKMNYPVYFTKEIDVNQHIDPHISSISNTVYQLNGVVMHMGTVQSGHYYSYVKNRATGEWYKFNDTNTEITTLDDIMKNANDQMSNAYLLFYDRADLVEVDDSSLTVEMKELIEKENETHLFNQFFYSKSFIHFLAEILKSNHSPELNNLALSYSMPIMMHMSTAYNLTPLINAISDGIKKENNEDFINSVYNNRYLNGIIRCESPQIQDDIYEKIYKQLIKHFTEEDLPKAKSLLDEISHQFDTVFEKLDNAKVFYELINKLLKFIRKYDKQFLENDEIVHRLQDNASKIIVELAPKKFGDQPTTERQKSICQSLHFGKLIEMFSIIPTPPCIVEKLKEPAFLTRLFWSRDKVSSYINTYKKAAEYFDVQSFFENEFIPKESLHVDFLNLVCALFHLLKEKAIPVMWTAKFQGYSQQIANAKEIAFAYACLCRNEIMPDVYISHLSEWLPKLMLHQNFMVRGYSLVAASFVVRHKVFRSYVSIMDDHPIFSMEWPAKADETIIDRAQKVKNLILYTILDEAKPLIQKDMEKVDKNSFMDLERYILKDVLDFLRKLKEFDSEENVHLFSQGDEEKINEMALFLVDHSQVCDIHLSHISRILSPEFAIPFFMKILPSKEFLSKCDLILLSRVDLVLEMVEKTVDKFPYQYLVDNFIPSFMFSSYKSFRKSSIRLLKILVEIINHKDLEKIVDTNFDQNCISNIESVLFILNSIKVKRPVLKYSLNTDQSTLQLGFNSFVEYSFVYNSEVDQINMPKAITLLSSQELVPRVKSIVLDYVLENCSDFGHFKSNFDLNCIFSLNDDQCMKISKILKSFTGNIDQEFILQFLIKLSKKSFATFLENCNFLIEKSFDVVNSINFQKSVLGNLYSYVHDNSENENRIDINHNEIFDKFLNVAFKLQKKEILFNDTIRHLIDLIDVYTCILEDPIPQALNKAELIDMIEPIIKLFNRFDIGLQESEINTVKLFIQQLKSEKVQQLLSISQLPSFADFLENYIHKTLN